MDMTGEYRIAASRHKVWDALNDPAILQQCIPGCEEIVKTSPTEMTAKATAKVGPVKARFGGKVTLSDLDPPNGYRISGEGNGGVAGFAKGGAKVHLADDGAGTVLTYEVHAQVGGKIAQLGARLIDASAKQMADAFFDRFTAHLTPPEPAAPEAPLVMPERPPAALPPSAISPLALVPRDVFGLPLIAWVGGLIYLVILFLVLGSAL
jgi:carbon monoxide dehydrogenase subunit G